MRKIILIALSMLCLLSLFACGKTQESETKEHVYVKHEAVTPTCDKAGNQEYYTCSDCDVVFDASKNTIEGIPTINALGHNYTLKAEDLGNCSQKGTISHYECATCHKLFDLLKNEVTSVEGDYDYSIHASTAFMSVNLDNVKVRYADGESFDPTGMVVTYKCSECDGYVLDNSQLTYVYQGVGASTFAIGDTKVTVCYGELSYDVAVTIEKRVAQISGVLSAYETTCGVAPVIEAVSSISSLEIIIEYYDAESNLVIPADFIAGNIYTARVYVEGNAEVDGAETTTTVTVLHNPLWLPDSLDEDKLVFKCACGDVEEFYALSNQIVYVDNEDMSIDLSKLVVGTDNYEISDIKQILLLGEHEQVEIVGTNEGLVYTFDVEKYEKTAFEGDGQERVYYTPYELALAVTFEIEGKPCTVSIISKYVDKVIRDAEDLLELAYTGEAVNDTGFAMTGYYVLANDIDASELTLEGSRHAFQAAIGFRGVFDGQGHTISNLTVPAWSNGLFGAIGYGATIKDVTFENVTVPVEVTPSEGTYVFAYAIRNATISNVSVSFTLESEGFKLANEINDTTIENVNVYTAIGHDASFVVTACEGEIAYEYMPYVTVTFDTDGGSEIAPVEVTIGKKLVLDVIPTKTDAQVEYEFDGWFIGEDRFDLNTPITTDLVLKAKWIAIEESPFGEILLNARNQAVTRWDYGGAITVSHSLDDTYGGIMVMSVSGGVEQGFRNPEIDTTGYEKVCFYIYNPCETQIRLFAHGTSTWGAKMVMLASHTWTVIEIDASLFAENDAGWVGFIVQDPQAISVAGEWKISSFFGIREGEDVPDAVNKVLVDAKTQLLHQWDYGSQISVTNSVDEVYGDVMVMTVANGAEQGFAHPSINTQDYERVYFFIYNPCDIEIRFNVHGANTWGALSVMLAPESWTKIELDATLFNEANRGWVGFVIQVPDVGSIAGDWMLTSFIGLEEGEEAQTPVSNVLVNAKTQAVERWDYGGAITVVNSTDATHSNVMVVTVAEGYEQGFKNPVIDVTGYEKVSFYIYNPCSKQVRLCIHGTTSWGAKEIMLDAQGWTKVEIDASLFEENGAGWVGFILQDPDAISVAGDWKITSFYGEN